MSSKKMNARDISKILGIDEPPEIAGGTIGKDWIISAVSAAPGCEDVDVGLGKQELLKAGIEALGGTWDDECASEGSTITATALARFAICLEPRLKEMREIWILLGKGGYPEVDHHKFVSTLYGYYFDCEMDEDMVTSIQNILTHLDGKHGLSEDEIAIDGEPTRSTYQVIMNHLYSIIDDEEEEEEGEEEDEEEEVKRFVRTKVSATQIASLKNWYQNKMLDLSPPWQRGDVWPPKKKKAVMESIMLGIPLPALILHRIEDEHGRLKSIEVIDGQQRLRAIMYYIENQFPLGDFHSSHELVNESKCYWDHPRKKSIDQEWRILIETTDIPILWFVNVEPKTLRKVFNLYNTAALKLNAAEIRNATYQTHELHRLAFIMAGENPEAEIYYVDEDDQTDFTTDWMGLGSTKRFAATELICQYFAYSRPIRSGPVFSGSITRVSINRFLDYKQNYTSAEISEMAQELIDSYNFTDEYFDLGNGIHHSFSRNNKNGVPKFNKLATITNMVASRMLKKLLDHDIIDEDAVKDAIETVVPSIEWPENQNAGTIWGYQADMINGLLQHLGISSDDDNVVQLLPKLIPCMDEIRNHSND